MSVLDKHGVLTQKISAALTAFTPCIRACIAFIGQGLNESFG